jgi:hypothetical protein
MPAWKTLTARVRLTKAARALLARRRHLRAISILELVPSRGTSRRTDTVFTLQAPAALRRGGRSRAPAAT